MLTSTLLVQSVDVYPLDIPSISTTVGFGYKKFGYKKFSDIRKFYVESYDNKHYLNFGYKNYIK